MNPYKLKDVFNYLTSNNQLLKRKLKLGTSEIPIPPKRDDVTAIEAINRFNKANPRVDATNIQPVVKQSAIKQSNVDEGVIQGAFDTATMEARDGGYPPPIYETFKKRYLKRNMKADGGRAGYEDGGMLVQPSDDGSRPGYKGKATDKADELLKAYSEEGANSPIKREIKKKILTNPAFKKFIGEDRLKKLSKLTSTEKGYTERNLISNFITQRKQLNMLPNKGEGYITAMNLADMLEVPENTFWNNLDSIKKDYPQYNLNKINSILSPEKITVKNNNFIYYKKPNKTQIKELKKFFDRPILNKQTVKALNEFANDESIMKMLNDRKFPSIEEAQDVLKKANLSSSESNTATAMLRLGEILQGKQFKNNINIKVNKVLGNYVVKQLENFNYYHPWSRGIYDAAVREITENVPTQVGSIEKYKTLLKNRLPKNFLTDKKLNLNETFSIKAAARNKAYPYAYFIDAIDKDINTKSLRNFHGNLSKAQDKLISAIDELKKAGSPQKRKIAYKKAEDIVAKFQKTRKAHKNTILKNHGDKPFNLPNLVLGKEKQILNEDIKIAESVYKKSNLDNWASSGIDIAGHAQKSGYVMTGADKPGTILATELASDTKTQAKLLRKMGFKCKFAGSNGGLGNCDDPASYTDDINKTRADLKSNDVTVRAAANAKLNKGLQIAKTLPTIGKFLRRVGQATVGGISKALQATGLGTPVGLAIEGMVEGGIYDYYRGQGYTHDQAYSETFFPGIITGREEGVPWYGGAESLLEKELIGDPQQNKKVAQYVSTLKDQDQVYDAFERLEQGQQAQRKDIIDTAQADIRDLNKSGTISNIDRIMNPESMASRAYQTAVETQIGRQDQRARDYKAKNYAQTEPSEFMQEQKLKDRNKAMLEMFPMYTPEVIDSMYEKANIEKPENFSIDAFNNVMRDQDKMNYFAENFRLEKASGGIASLTDTIPPESGPTPHGLPYVYNNVKKI